MYCLEGQEIFFERIEEKKSRNAGHWKTVVSVEGGGEGGNRIVVVVSGRGRFANQRESIRVERFANIWFSSVAAASSD